MNFTVRLSVRLLPALSESVTVNRAETDLRPLSARVIAARLTDEIESLTVRFAPVASFAETLFSA